MSLHSLRYQSTIVAPIAEEDMRAMLVKARAFNAANQISGMLLYRDGQFVQVLEGEEATIRILYDKILCDPRHTNMQMLEDAPLNHRKFASWTMAYRS
ncbi:BLUF domain-containing protein [Hymenobacter negativus]|uniref:BLUF domain-containing protein n=1 Tax=Hymenobacter negativus TaxID=2795026 RepID=A0ABS3QGN2_9BACT|nr:BLUF domain-containing protein [Hymenobacter negativus]